MEENYLQSFPVLSILNVKKYQVYWYYNLRNQKNPESTELQVSLLQNIWAFDYIYGNERHNQHMLVLQNSEIESYGNDT